MTSNTGAITLRSDEEVERALTALGATAGNRSKVVREAILCYARQVRRDQLRAEAAMLAADKNDLAEVAAVRKQMDELRAW